MPERWIDRIADPELKLRIRRLMLELLVLAEAKAAAMEPFTSHGKGGTKEPPRTFSLAQHYSEKFAACHGDVVQLEATYIKGKYELEAFKGGGQNTDRVQIQQERSEAVDIQRLVQYGQGVPTPILAARHQWPMEWIRMVRRRNEQDPETGHPRPRWRELGEDARYEMVEILRVDEGMTQREAAMRLGISKGSVNNYWSRKERAA